MLFKVFFRLFYAKVIFLWIPKPQLKSHIISLVQPGLLLWNMEEGFRKLSKFCLLILENYILLACDSNLRLFDHWVVFFCSRHFFDISRLSLFLQLSLFASISLCLVSYHSLIPTWGMAFLPENTNLHGSFSEDSFLAHYFSICGLPQWLLAALFWRWH